MELAFLTSTSRARTSRTGPGFEYLDQTGIWHSAPSYPVAPTGQLTASGAGTLFISPWSSSGLLGIEATKASNAVNIAVPAPSCRSTVTDPKLTLTYKGAASKASTPIFAQLLDSATGTVLDNQATAGAAAHARWRQSHRDTALEHGRLEPHTGQQDRAAAHRLVEPVLRPEGDRHGRPERHADAADIGPWPDRLSGPTTLEVS